MWIPPHPQDVPDGDRIGPFRGGGFIAMLWYKHHGGIESMVRVDGWDSEKRQKAPNLLTLVEAEAALENLEIVALETAALAPETPVAPRLERG